MEVGHAVWTVQERIPKHTEPLSADIEPLLDRVFRNRGIVDPAHLNHRLTGLLDPAGMRGMDAAVDLVIQSLECSGEILVVGDFDADGATSCALAVLGLRAFGAEVDYLVPNRFEYGYGLTPEIVALTAARPPWLLITVDNGISSHAGVEAARAAGSRVLITDHHLAGDRLPAADAILNPNQPGCGFGSKALAGVGVVFYLLIALRRALTTRGWFDRRQTQPPNLSQWLDLVALGTLADLVPLDHNNRILVDQGMRRIRQGRCRPGIRALAEVAHRDLLRLSCADVGFGLAPRLNAAGRMQDMRTGIECLLAETDPPARAIAADLDQLNRERRTTEQRMQLEAQQQMLTLDQTGSVDAGVVLFDSSWHAGVIGILAARVKERVYRPTICFAPGSGAEIKGSARSISGVHMRDILAEVDRRSPDLLLQYGGHAMAAGVTIAAADLERFRGCFIDVLRDRVDPNLFEGRLLTDGSLTEGQLSLDVARKIRYAAPWGQAFPEPMFEGWFEVRSHRVAGEKHLRMRIAQAASAGAEVDAILFNADFDRIEEFRAPVRFVYRLDVNFWRGEDRLQLRIEHWPAPDSSPIGGCGRRQAAGPQ